VDSVWGFNTKVTCVILSFSLSLGSNNLISCSYWERSFMEISFKFFYTEIDVKSNGELFLFLIFLMGFLHHYCERVC
jgi:hypothetical protein